MFECFRSELRVLANSDSEMQSFESCCLSQPVRSPALLPEGSAKSARTVAHSRYRVRSPCATRGAQRVIAGLCLRGSFFVSRFMLRGCDRRSGRSGVIRGQCVAEASVGIHWPPEGGGRVFGVIGRATPRRALKRVGLAYINTRLRSVAIRAAIYIF
jgi:hypothetical protein